MTTRNTTNNLIKLNDVRLSYPALFRPKVWADSSNEPKYEATFILNKVTHGKEIQAIDARINELLAEHKISRSKIKADHLCLRDGDLTDKEEYQGAFTLKSSTGRKFPIVNRDAKTRVVEEDNLLYGGCYVSAYIDLRYYNNKSIGIAANLKSLQYRGPGEAFGGNEHDITDAYEPVEYEPEEDLF